MVSEYPVNQHIKICWVYQKTVKIIGQWMNAAQPYWVIVNLRNKVFGPPKKQKKKRKIVFALYHFFF